MMIGIDLGTTFSVIAVQGRVEAAPGYPAAPRYLEPCDITILPDPYGSYIIPSALWEDPDQPGTWIVGAAAKQAADEGNSPILFSKRTIGTDVRHPLGSREWSAREVAREILVYLKGIAEQALGQRVDRAVITHPAYFDPAMKEETALAARDAGLDFDPEKHLLMEPIAAALAYTRTDSRDPLRLLTYDLGGGTFDVTAMERRRGVTTIKAFGGDRLLGGFNFDRELARWLLRRLQERGVQITIDLDDPRGRGKWARLMRLAEDTKIRLAEARTDKMVVQVKQQNIFEDDLGRPVHLMDTITREQFVQLIGDLVDGTITGSGREGESKGCDATLVEVGWRFDQVDEILLVGGSSAGPWIAGAIRRLWNREPQVFEPDLCVAAGAAIHAASLPEPVGGPLCRVELDVPRQTVLDSINVAGRLLPADGVPLPRSLSVLLTQPGRRLSAEVGPQGGFLFQDVALQPETVTRLGLSVVDANGLSVFEHQFEVEHTSEGGGESTSVLTVLPKPLYIEVLDGMKPLAPEGATLPAHCEVELMRVNEESTIEIHLFQESDPLGTVVIEKVPPEAVGAKVKLEVDVSRNNRITGRACVFTRKGAVAAETSVDIRIPQIQIPGLDELREELAALESEREERLALERSAEERMVLEARGEKLRGKIERMLAAPAPDRQEVWLALRDLRQIVRPLKDELEPPLDQFERLVLRLREVVSAQGADPIAQGHAKLVDRLEREGRAAHARKDRKLWAQACSHLENLLHRLERPNPGTAERETPPTALQKLFARMQLDQIRAQLRAREAELMTADKLIRVQAHVNRLRADLDDVESAIEGIDDNLDGRSAKPKLQLLFMQRVKKIEDTIPTLGVDVK